MVKPDPLFDLTVRPETPASVWAEKPNAKVTGSTVTRYRFLQCIRHLFFFILYFWLHPRSTSHSQYQKLCIPAVDSLGILGSSVSYTYVSQ